MDPNQPIKYIAPPTQIIKDLRQQVGLSHQFRRGQLIDGQEVKVEYCKNSKPQNFSPMPYFGSTEQGYSEGGQLQSLPSGLGSSSLVNEQFSRNISINDKDYVIFTSKVIQENKDSSEQEKQDEDFEIQVSNTMQKLDENFIERKLIIETRNKRIIFLDIYQLIPNLEWHILNQKLNSLEQKHQQDMQESFKQQQKVIQELNTQYQETVNTYDAIVKQLQSKINGSELNFMDVQEKQKQFLKMSLTLEQKDLQIRQLQQTVLSKQESIDELDKQVKLYISLNDSLRQQISIFIGQPQPQQPHLISQNMSYNNLCNPSQPILASKKEIPVGTNTANQYQQNLLLQNQQSSQSEGFNLPSNQFLSQNLHSKLSQHQQQFDSILSQNQLIQGSMPNLLTPTSSSHQLMYNQTNSLCNIPNTEAFSSPPISHINTQQLNQLAQQVPPATPSFTINQQPRSTISSQINQSENQQIKSVTIRFNNSAPKLPEQQQDISQNAFAQENQNKEQTNEEQENQGTDGQFLLGGDIYLNHPDYDKEYNQADYENQDDDDDDDENKNDDDESENSTMSKTKKIQKSRKKYKSRGRPRRNAKNVPKNFLKAFKSFLCSQTEVQVICDIMNFKSEKDVENYRTKYIDILKHNKINNETLLFFISYEDFKDTFKFFLDNRAEKWIVDSTLMDKPVHLDCLNIYKNSFNNKAYLAKIKVNQTKNHTPITLPPKYQKESSQ